MQELDLAKLARKFKPDELEWRIGRSGKGPRGVYANLLCYVTNRAIMDRLDEVVGPGNWQNEFKPWGDKSQLCGISIRIGDTWVTKWDGASNTAVEAVKGGLSDSMKRAAVQWGIGRYLYKMGDTWAVVSVEAPKSRDGWNYAKLKDGSGFYWKEPQLEKIAPWAMPEEGK